MPFCCDNLIKKEAGKRGVKPGSPDGKRVQKLETLLQTGPTPVVPVSPDSIKEDSSDYLNATISLLRRYPGEFQTVRIPCYVAEGPCPVEPGTLRYKAQNMLYLDIHCPSIRPQLVVLSNQGKQTVQFGGICVSQSSRVSVTIQNISNETVTLTCHPLNPNGPFVMLNALRELSPQASHNIILSFTPRDAHVYQESLNISTGDTVLRLTLKGEGVKPKLEVKGMKEGQQVFSVGSVLVNEYVERPMVLMNQSSLAIEYSISLDSSDLPRRHEVSQFPQLGDNSDLFPAGAATSGDPNKRNWVGVQNYNGAAVFDCVPYRGRIAAGESKEVLITFAPDHESDLFSDGLHITLFDQEETHYFQIKGEAKPHIMYIQGGDQAIPKQDHLLPEVVLAGVVEDPKAPKGTLVFTLTALMDTSGQIKPAQKAVTFGCVRTMAVSQKKNGEFSFDNLNALTGFGFSVEPQKGQLEAGTTKQAIISWKPPSNHDPNKPLNAMLLVSLRSDVTEVYRILLCGVVVTNEKLVESAPTQNST